MPLYDSECPSCGGVMEFHSTVDQRDCTPQCPRCGGATVRVMLKAPMGFVKGNFDAFRSPVDGSLIATQNDLSEHNKRNNVVNIHDGYDEKTVLSGDFGQKLNILDRAEIVEDLKESIHRLNQGYKPVIGEQDAD